MTRIRRLVQSERGIFEPALSEEHILRVIVEEMWLRYRIKLWRINCPVGGKVRPNQRGIPDLVGWVPKCGLRGARPLFIEVKRPGGRRRLEQVLFIEEASRDGCIALFADNWHTVWLALAAAGILPIGEKY